MKLSIPGFTALLATAIFNVSMLGRAQIWQEVAVVGAKHSTVINQLSQARETRMLRPSFAALILADDFEPLPFDEAIDYFDSLVPLSRTQFADLEARAQRKAFTLAAGATEQITTSIQDLLDQAMTDGLTLREFQSQADDILDRAGVSERSNWYWQTVYRTNLQTSYQVGRWQQMTDPYVKERRPYLRYLSARLPTSRSSHVEKHGLIYPVDDPFWNIWFPPNGFNCYCTAESVSEDLLAREDWSVSRRENWGPPDSGFATNPGVQDEI